MKTINDYTQIKLLKMTDESLVQLAQEKNNEEAISALLNRYRGLLLFFSKKYYIQGADINDTFQEALIGFYKAVIDFKYTGGISFHGFAKMCVNRHLISSVKKANRNKNAILNNSLSLQAKINHERDLTYGEVVSIKDIFDPEKQLIIKESYNELLSTNSYLTNFEKRALLLVLEGYSHNEAGEIMGVSSKGIQNAMYRIRKKTRDENFTS